MPILAPPSAPLSDGVVVLRAWRSEDRDRVVAALQDPRDTALDQCAVAVPAG
jgi:hypothetical protein